MVFLNLLTTYIFMSQTFSHLSHFITKRKRKARKNDKNFDIFCPIDGPLTTVPSSLVMCDYLLEFDEHSGVSRRNY